MKISHFLAFTLLIISSLFCQAQTPPVEPPINQELLKATIVQFKPPYKELVLNFEKEDFERFSIVMVTDAMQFLKKSGYGKKNPRPDDMLKPGDMRPGMTIRLTIDYFQISHRCVAKRVGLEGDYYGMTSITGLFEQLDGNQAIIDGHRVQLELPAGKAIEGREGWKGQRFTSFREIQLGSEVSVRGERRVDGIVYATSGTNEPLLMSKDDYFLRRATDRAMKVSKTTVFVSRSWQFRFINNFQAQDYVASVGKKLIPAYLKSLPIDHPDRIDFKFFLVNDPSFNASALPNGTVVIHKGLLTHVDNEAQLAAILGHEIAHVTQKHFASQFRRHKNWEAVKVFGEVAGVVTGDATPIVVTQLMAEASMSDFSQTQEAQADRIGLYYMASAGYDPREAAVIWKRLADEANDENERSQRGQAAAWINKSFQGERVIDTDEDTPAVKVPPKVQPIFPTHPKPEKRLTNINFLIGTAYANLPPTPQNNRAPQLKAIVKLIGKG